MKQVENRRTIKWRPVKRLDQQVEPNSDLGSSSGTGTDHTHNNKLVLDKLGIDNNGRLTNSGQVFNVPLIDEQW